MGFLRWLSRPYYSALDGDELPDRFKNSHVWKSLLPWLLGALLISASFAVGRLSVANATAEAQSQKAIKTEETFRGLSLEVVHHEFIYNRTFGENSLAAAKAWEDLFPQQGGYFRHPVIAPRRATFSVFHYLHCLNGIREGYWAVYGMTVTGTKLDPETSDLPLMISPPHIRHCVDLLRQALICSPDLTVETKDEAAGGVHGFGETHQCVDWMQVKNWTAKWESWA